MKHFMNLYDGLHWENADEYFEGTLRKVLREENGRFVNIYFLQYFFLGDLIRLCED